MAESTIVVSLAGEAFDGPPRFEVRLGTKVVGSAALINPIETETEGRLFSSPKPGRFVELFTFSVPDGDLRNADISIVLTNDKYVDNDAEGFDRNLFIDFIRVNGHEISSAEMALIEAGEPQNVDFQAGMLPIYENGQSAVARPPRTGWPLPGASPATSRPPDRDVPPPMTSRVQVKLGPDYR